MPVYSHLVPSPVPGNVNIAGTVALAAWELDGVNATIKFNPLDRETVDKLWQAIINAPGPLYMELLRGDDALVVGEAFIDGVMFDGRLELKATFQRFDRVRYD